MLRPRESVLVDDLDRLRPYLGDSESCPHSRPPPHRVHPLTRTTYVSIKRTVYVSMEGSHMNAHYDTARVSFVSRGTRCAGWLTLPDGPGPHPGLVLAHGLGATHGMLLAQYEQHFAAAGIATLAFDYRYTGESGGEPRQQFSMRAHRQDVESALDYLRQHNSIDAARVGLWGTSLGALHVLQAARAESRYRSGGGAMPDRARTGNSAPKRYSARLAADAGHRRRMRCAGRAGPAEHMSRSSARPAAWPRSPSREHWTAGIRPSRRDARSITAWRRWTSSVSR